MFAYDENGDLREFEDYENIVVCNHCKKLYRQHIEEQIPGFRDIDDDICPYCHESNGRSGDVEFYNEPFSDVGVKILKEN